MGKVKYLQDEDGIVLPTGIAEGIIMHEDGMTLAEYLDDGSNGHEYVDLGLPSGRLWAKCNIGAESETDYGTYYQWGSLVPYANSNQYYTGETDLDDAHDIAVKEFGGKWRMPTKEEFQELYDNTTNSLVTLNGVAGRKFVSKKDTSKYVFFPAAGYYYSGSLSNSGSRGYYWSRSQSSSSYAYYLSFSSSYVYPQLNGNRYYGFSVRPVL